MTTDTISKPAPTPITIKELNTENPRWCAGCGDFGIIMGLKRFIVERQLSPSQTVNVSGIGCSGRAPNYFNTYGVHSIHGRAIPIALGIALAQPGLNLFVHSGDGDALSIGGNHLIHGINKNFKCVFLMYDNEVYALTKNQTSPTTRHEHPTNTQPQGTFLNPLNPITLVLGLGASFVASTADWIPDHLTNTMKAAFDHPGFAFVHISQRCPHFDPNNFDHKNSSWFSFLKHPNGIEPDRRLAAKTETVEHDPSNLTQAFSYGAADRRYFGLFFQNKDKPRYDNILHNLVEKAPKKDPSKILDSYLI
ncbi:MAG: 2-oxoglutarate oxidoreductase [Candidatus Omnitrophica bacterium]|nr:2-oxoglutarate oxidoreductase [Candidatus Omnitrophota bacterium]MDE2214272.1 2-oxoglutarate oxidoreductase [Candidatus Omnitrophota bacterium]MDE2231309.1 2-oxoglutarate oxidoreductase [Candidatus Omnitrophota bacterium]